jgi:hypothetical protein
MYAHCPRHPDSPSIEAEVDVAPLEKNSIAAGMKILDKFMPTLASMSQNISVQGTITTVSAQLVKIIYEFVPPADRKQCMERIDELLSVVQKGDGDRPEQGPDQPSS